MRETAGGVAIVTNGDTLADNVRGRGEGVFSSTDATPVKPLAADDCTFVTVGDGILVARAGEGELAAISGEGCFVAIFGEEALLIGDDEALLTVSEGCILQIMGEGGLLEPRLARFCCNDGVGVTPFGNTTARADKATNWTNRYNKSAIN